MMARNFGSPMRFADMPRSSRLVTLNAEMTTIERRRRFTRLEWVAIIVSELVVLALIAAGVV